MKRKIQSDKYNALEKIIINDLKNDLCLLKITFQKRNGETVELTDNDDALSKDVFKTSVLREAYGDACLKLVIRKCYKVTS